MSVDSTRLLGVVPPETISRGAARVDTSERQRSAKKINIAKWGSPCLRTARVK